MNSILEQIAICVERGKINAASPYPPDMKGQKGADELTKEALECCVSANDVLSKGLIVGMNRIGVKFKADEVFVPDVLMSAKAMKSVMAYIKQSNEGKRKGEML